MEDPAGSAWTEVARWTEGLLGLSWERLTAFGWAYVASTLALLLIGAWRLRRGEASASPALATRHEPETRTPWIAGLVGVATFVWLLSHLFANPNWLVTLVRNLLEGIGIDNQGSFTVEMKAIQFSTCLAAQALSIAALLALGRLLPGSMRTLPDGTDAERLHLNRRGLARLGWLFATCVTLLTLGSIAWTLFASIAESQGQALPNDVQPLVAEITRWSGPTWLLAVLFTSISLGAPIFEELGFRAVLYPALRGAMPRGWAIALTGLLFGMMHGNVAALLPISLMGAWLCIVRDRHGIGACMIVHAMSNAWTVLWLILAPEVSARS